MSGDDSETLQPPKKKVKTSSSCLHHLSHIHDEDISSDDESEEWEEVEDQEFEDVELDLKSAKHGHDSEKAVEISIDVPGTSGAKNNRAGKSQWAKLVQWQVNRFNKLLQLQLHKTHLVCLLAAALHSNKMCNDTELQALALSQVPMRLVHGVSSSRSFDMSWFTKVIKWLVSSYIVQNLGVGEPNHVKTGLSQCLMLMVAPCHRDRVYIFLTTVRALGLQARLVESLQPIRKKYLMFSAVSERQKLTPKKRKSHAKAREKSQKKRTKVRNRKIVSSNSEEETSCNEDVSRRASECVAKKDEGTDHWIEVYNPANKQWMCVDCVRGRINQPNVCEQNATKPISYVIAIDNENSAKDVTQRYASKWMFETEKLRVQSDWWRDTLKPYCTSYTSRDETEDEVLQKQLLEKPLPTSITEYKNHHLYALKRHLLKFEALYPPSAAIVGYCKGEAVYARECVHTLHTRETWLKRGLSIRRDEKPYKMVKGRPRRNKPDEALLPLFGKWQTELYIPPPAVDGKVPRNEYGNVELFQPSMLPMGTVHLHIPGLHRTAQKLGIDCAPAMIGWDYHGGYCHPVFDGFVVCKEFQEVLLDAWQKEESEKEQQRKQKRDIRIWKNWKVLIKGVLVKDRLNKLYNIETTGKKSSSHSEKSSL